MKKQLLLSLIVFFSLQLAAQPGQIDQTFNSTDIGFGNGDGANKCIYTSIVRPDGKALIGGAFTSYNGTPRKCIARLNVDGSLDYTFNPGSGFSGDPNWLGVYAVELQPDGKILVGGNFSEYNGYGVQNLVRLNPDGSIDSLFDSGNGLPGTLNYSVYAICIQPDHKILIGGAFTLFNNISVGRIVRLNPNGSHDNTFQPPAFNDYVNTFSLRPDGRIYVGGTFTNAGGGTIHRLVRLMPDGSIDPSFNTGFGGPGIYPGFSDPFVNSIQPADNDKIMVAGRFGSYFGKLTNAIIRLNSDGSQDTTFISGLSPDPLSIGVSSICKLHNGKYMICGGFSYYQGIARRFIARILEDGSLDLTFNPGAGFAGYNESAISLNIHENGKILVSGDFRTYNNRLVPHSIIRLNENGQHDISFNKGSGANGRVTAIHIQNDSKILVGGDFSMMNGEIHSSIARLHYNGELDPSFDTGDGANNTIRTFATQPDGKIIIGGVFSTYNNFTVNRLARLNTDGSLDHTFNTGSGPSGFVNYVSIQPDGKILIGGGFTLFNGKLVNRIARLDIGGSIDTTFRMGYGAASEVTHISMIRDEKILIAGAFNYYDSVYAPRLIRVNSDGAIDHSFNKLYGINGMIRSVNILNNDQILIGGQFTTVNNLSRKFVARLHPDGSLDGAFNPGYGANGIVLSSAVQDDGKILIGGHFTYYDSIAVKYIARLNADGSFDSTFQVGTGANNWVHVIAIQQDQKILAGGDFTSINGIGRNRIARIIGEETVGSRLHLGSQPLNIYPNPTTGLITVEISHEEENTTLRLYDLTGRLLIEYNNLRGRYQHLNLHDQPSGIYFIEVVQKTYTSRSKIIKR
ncbi:MAG: T9SS type A sorting domain-containing protein [Bacteroidales bacterium]|nr:T9SS type A sorting domain-containing protein [Bacteroidales bacterium]